MQGSHKKPSRHRGNPVDIFYLDFFKAFDKVPRQRLVKKMQAKGLDPSVVT